MININRVVLVGRITKDLELRKTKRNLSATSFTVAVDRRYAPENGQKCDFINCIAFKHSADFLTQYASKGTIVSVEGRIQTRNYEDNGKKVYVTEILAENVQIISQRKEDKDESHEDTSSFGGYASNSGQDIGIEADELPFY